VRAALLHAVGGDFTIKEVPTPEPGPGEVLVRIAGAGVCHSDVHLKAAGALGMAFPHILGHENAGWVETFGAGVTGLRAGDAVVVFGGWGCGLCRYCLGGSEQLCDGLRWGGIGPAGGYAEYLLVPSARHLLPAGSLDLVDAAPLTDAALTPYAAVQKVRRRLVAGTTAVVVGAGGLGQFAVQFLKLFSPATVIAVDTSAGKRAAARALGADYVVDPADADAVDQIRAAGRGRGAAAVIDFVGVDSTLAMAAKSLDQSGIVVLIGLSGGSYPFSFFSIPFESTLTTSNWGTRNQLEEVLALAQDGQISVAVERRPLEEINAVFAELERGAIAGRAVLIPGLKTRDPDSPCAGSV
jgi:alcohol dehydrogenase, propanol-preferring